MVEEQALIAEDHRRILLVLGMYIERLQDLSLAPATRTHILRTLAFHCSLRKPAVCRYVVHKLRLQRWVSETWSRHGSRFEFCYAHDCEYTRRE